jgi:hypothetical protein
LSIQTGLNGLSFSILDPGQFKYIALRHYPFEGLKDSGEIANYISIIYNQDDFLKLKYKDRYHSFISEFSSLIPLTVFNPDSINKYLSFIYQSSGKYKYESNMLSVINSVNVFGYPESLITCLFNLFPDIKLFHHSTPFIDYLIKESVGKKEPLCFVYLSDEMVYFGIANNSKLLFYNSFRYKEKTDIAYFILSVLEQFNLSPATIGVSISSDAFMHDEIFEYLNNYLGQIKFILPSSKFSYSYLFDELYLTRFTNLFNLALCE